MKFNTSLVQGIATQAGVASLYDVSLASFRMDVERHEVQLNTLEYCISAMYQ